MNNQIINNLYELWSEIGKITNSLNLKESYSTVSMKDSDWPNRVYNLQNNDKQIDEIIDLCKEGKLPEIITVSKPNNLGNKIELDFFFGQVNMAIDLKYIDKIEINNPNIIRVESKQHCIDFANTASQSFGYRVDYKVIQAIIKTSNTIQAFIYKEDNEALGCGIIYFDSNNNAGLHMIGTLPQGRGKGIGKLMTQKLLMQAMDNNKIHCVLHASKMGESIYKRLGFEPFGEIETYKINKK